MSISRPKVPSFYEPKPGDIVQAKGLKAGSKKNLPVWRPTQIELATCDERVAIEKGQDLRIACRPSYNCSYDWILDAGEGARHRWLMARDDQVKVVAYSYLDLTGKIVRPVSKNIWLRPSVPNSAWVQVNHDTDDVILCVGYNAGGHAQVIYAGNLYTVAPRVLETTIVTPSSVPLV